MSEAEKDMPIPAEAIEAAAKAIQRARCANDQAPFDPAVLGVSEAALRAAFDALEMEREVTDSRGITTGKWRLVSRWFPVKP